MFVYLKTPDMGTQGQNEGGRLVGGEVRAREGSFFFFFFLYHIFVVKVQEIAWSPSYGENKTQNPKRTNKRNIRHQKLFSWGPYRSQALTRARNSTT